MKKRLQSFLCKLGIHAWHSRGENVQGESVLITLVWWECDVCGESKLKCILGNWPTNKESKHVH